MVGLLFAAQVSAQGFARKPILIKEAPDCSTWFLNQGKDELRGWGNANWLFGYLAGIATDSQRKQLRGVPSENILLWMDKYCKGDMLNRNVEDGARELLRVLPTEPTK